MAMGAMGDVMTLKHERRDVASPSGSKDQDQAGKACHGGYQNLKDLKTPDTWRESLLEVISEMCMCPTLFYLSMKLWSCIAQDYYHTGVDEIWSQWFSKFGTCNQHRKLYTIYFRTCIRKYTCLESRVLNCFAINGPNRLAEYPECAGQSETLGIKG